MPYSIQLRFDKQAEQKILKLSESLADIGLIDPRKSHGSMPHIAAVVFRECDPETLITSLEKLARHPFDVRFDSLGTFPTSENVIFLGVADSAELSALQLDLFRQLNSQYPVDQFYGPGLWHPHCTVGIDFSDEDFFKAFSLFKSRFVPFTCRVERLVATKFRPSEVLFERVLGRRETQ